MYERLMARVCTIRYRERGATTVEWLGLATIAILVIALLLPQVRNTAGDIWSNVANEFGGFFG
jgi:Flp pilus assembly pilin Flp